MDLLKNQPSCCDWLEAHSSSLSTSSLSDKRIREKRLRRNSVGMFWGVKKNSGWRATRGNRTWEEILQTDKRWSSGSLPLMRHKHTEALRDSRTETDERGWNKDERNGKTEWTLSLALLTAWQETDPPSKISTMLKKAKDRDDFPLPVRPQIPT